MRLGSLLRAGRPALAVVSGDRALAVGEIAAREPERFGALAGAADVSALWSPEGREALEAVAGEGDPERWKDCAEPLDACRWLPPVASPEKLICIGLNYSDHAAESGMEIPKEPVFFSKFNNALVGAAGPVVLPKNSTQVDYEAELAVVIGREAKRVSEKEAEACVGGYTLLHDVSARDWQFRTGQWISGKTFDTFAPCGPCLVTPDEVPDPRALAIRLTLNGAVMQDSSTNKLIFGVPALIAYLSHVFTLRPGDIISTGTPPGVGFARKPPVFLKDGDVVEISVERVGTMRHRCVAEP